MPCVAHGVGFGRTPCGGGPHDVARVAGGIRVPATIAAVGTVTDRGA
jgi:hypothetical protein